MTARRVVETATSADAEKALQKPVVSHQLLDHLHMVAPVVYPDPSWPKREVWSYGGQLSIIRHLVSLYEEQTGERYTPPQRNR